MGYDPTPSHNSDTDDDIPPHQNRIQRSSHISGNGTPMLGPGSFRRAPGDMEYQIHNLEKEAYCAVLRAFKAQSDAISWDKESLITELRKELRVSDVEHRELLVSVNNDDTIRLIREWRQSGGHLSALHPTNDMVSPTTSGPRKKQRTSQPLPPHAGPPVQPSPSGPAVAPRGRKPRQFPHSNHATYSTAIPGFGAQLQGRKVLIKWPEDGNYYDAEITEYNPADGRHAVVYGIHTPQESFEWVNIMDIAPGDIRWVNEDPGLSQRGGLGERPNSAAPGAGWKKNELQNGTGNMVDDIEILHTDTLIKEVEKVVAASNPDRLDIEKAKKMLKDHELALLDAISRLSYVSDGDSGNRLMYL